MGSLFNRPINPLSLADALLKRRRVTAIRTNQWFGNSWESITHLKADGVWFTKQEVVDHIRHDHFLYFTHEDGTTAYLIVEYPGGLAPPYVRTKPDCSFLNNLLSLPRG